jgi:glucose-1-phosphate cytidylyltransferase
MKVVILAGGFGTRLSEETSIKPKPMVEIGGMPILWHIMKIYSYYGFNDFLILLGYKGYSIKEYFINYHLHTKDFTVDLKTNGYEIHNEKSEPWKVTLVDTGLETLTGGRIKKAQKYLNNESFFLTYGDGLSDVNIEELLKYHKSNKKTLTMTTVIPEPKYGNIKITESNLVTEFSEKSHSETENAWINGGFFVCEPNVFEYINGNESFEIEPMQRLCEANEVVGLKHRGFWKCMDT